MNSVNERPNAPATSQRSPLAEVFFYFTRLGMIGFGGPLALIGMMQRDLVEQRGWVDRAKFAQAFPLIKAMPGPVAFMTAVFLSRQHAGWRGGFAAAFGLIAPSFALMILFGVFYERLQGVQVAQIVLLGMQAGALGVIIASLKGMMWSHRLKPVFWILAFVAAAITFRFPAWEPLLIISSGILTALLFHFQELKKLPHSLMRVKLGFAPIAMTVPGFFIGESTSAAISKAGGWWSAVGDMVWACFKAGAFVFGSGLAIVPLMEHDFVNNLGWLTHNEFMDALAFGQITPGPFVITVTFIGFKTLGFLGAAIATITIFLPAFFHMMTWFPAMLNRLSRLPWINAFLTGATAAVVGAIGATVLLLGAKWTGQPIQLFLIAVVLGAALFSKLPGWSLIPLSGVLGWVLNLVF